MKGLHFKAGRVSVDLIVSVALLMLGLFLFYLASDYPKMARTFPQLVLLVVIVLAMLDILTKLWARTKATHPLEEASESKESRREAFRFLHTVALMFAFLFLMMIAGFTLGTFLFLMISASSLGYRNIKALTLSSLAFTGFMYTIFIWIMSSFLPRGLIFDIIGR